MGWLWLGVIGGATWLALWLAAPTRPLWKLVGAAVMLAAAGYTWQQHATLPGHPVPGGSQPISIDPGLAAFRAAIMPGKPGDDILLAAADDAMREGDTQRAADMLLAAAGRDPGDAKLWTGAASALCTHDGDEVSPAALFAFRRAMALEPNSPGPPYFLGLAFAKQGDLAAAKHAWLRALALTPRDAAYRTDIGEQLMMIDQMQAQMQVMSGAPLPRR